MLRFCVALLLLCDVARSTEEPSLYLTAEQLCRRQARYLCESHVVQTGDGYLLQMDRVAVDGDRPGPPVIVQHGLALASDSWVLAERHNSLGFLLADEGYDVWMGNLRGNTFSRNHTTLTTDQKEFWTFTWHEMGVWDVPAMVRYVRLARGDGQLPRYVAHSMGATAMLVACSELRGWCSGLRGAVLMAPGAYLSHSRSPAVRTLMNLHDRLWDLFYMSGRYECLTHNHSLLRIVKRCDRNSHALRLCEDAYNSTLGQSYFGVNKTIALTFLAHFLTGTSIYTLDHFTQIIKSGKFQHYDRSITGRLNKRSTMHVADYNLSKVTVPTAIYYSQADMFVDARDVLKLSRSLPNVVTLHEVADPKFDHFSFVAGYNVTSLLYDKILANLRAM